MDAEFKSPWLTTNQAIEYLTNGERTPEDRRRIGPRRLVKIVRDNKLRAARIGGRGQLMFRREWLDQYLDDQATPVMVPIRRRA